LHYDISSPVRFSSFLSVLLLLTLLERILTAILQL
jgi:hypothetical protein